MTNNQKKFTGSNYSDKLSIVEIAKEVREQLKKDFPECKFSVTKQSFSMGRSLTVSLVSAPFEVLIGGGKYKQLNQFYINDSKELTEKGKETMSKVHDLINSYNFDDSDSQSDYCHVNFFEHLQVGQWNKDFKNTCKMELVK